MYVIERFLYFFPFHVNCYFEGIEQLEKNWEFEILLLFFLQPLPKPLGRSLSQEYLYPPTSRRGQGRLGLN